jgi:DNA-binding transcriptional MerR regulator
MDARGLRIGELAGLAGTTTRAIRHYHAIGLIGEPERDESGYRRYGPEHVVAVVRIRRLRSLGMPLDQIAGQLEPADLSAALRSLAVDISQQIAELVQLRERVLDIAASGAAEAPLDAWTRALGQDGPLPAGEQEAVDLVDALHPQGIRGVIDQASDLMSDPARRERLESLIHRFKALPDDADDEKIEKLAGDYAALMPRPTNPPPSVDLDTMDKLLGDRFSSAQRRCLHRVRELLERRSYLPSP